MNPKLAILIKRIFNFVSILGILATIMGAIYLYRIGALTDEATLRRILLAHEILAPFIFISIQIIGVVIPVIPGGVSLAVGVLIFGPVLGFVYNYVGICVGSVLLFYIGRSYGGSLIKIFVKEKTYNRFIRLYERGQRYYDWAFFWLMVAPVAPDDALVLISSQTKMTWRFFILSVLIGKIPSILAYSYALIYGAELIKKFIGG